MRKEDNGYDQDDATVGPPNYNELGPMREEFVGNTELLRINRPQTINNGS